MDGPADTLDEREVRINNSKKLNITPIYLLPRCLSQLIYLKIIDKGVPPSQLSNSTRSKSLEVAHSVD